MTNIENRFLLFNKGYWHYQRRVPKKFRHIESRSLVRGTLGTTSLEIARLRRDALVAADDHYWTALALEAAENDGVSKTTYEVEQHRYLSACSSALLHGFTYKPVKQLVKHTPVEELIERTQALAAHYDSDNKLPLKHTQALLGGVRTPKQPPMQISEVFKMYVEVIAFDAQRKKSDAQRKSWEKAKRTSVNYFVEAIGNIDIGDVDRQHALDYRNWWAERITNGSSDGSRPTPYTANRHIGNLRSLYREYYSYKGQEDKPNPFRRLSFKEDRSTKKKRSPFETSWLKNRILEPGIFSNINDEARHILYALIETGARPSEICNLRPDNIRLTAKVPYLAIRETESREIKADASDRDIPLVGISLAAMKLNPNGFPRYFDKETNLSAILMKNLKARNLLPTSNHKVYSIRHSFEKRMLEAGLEYDLRCTLMGHKNERPEYGDGGSLEFRRSELEKIVFPYDGWDI